MTETITLSDDAIAPIEQMLDEMEAKGTLRSRDDSVSGTSAERTRWKAGFASQQAVTQFFEDRWSIHCTIDTRAYDGIQADDGDIYQYETDDGRMVEANSVEIKKTGTGSNHHVSITEGEEHLIGDDEPIIYVQTEFPDSGNETPCFEVVGWCIKDDLHWVEKGAKPWTQSADNLCEPLSEMRTDWAELCERLFPEATPSEQSKFTFSA